MNIMSMNYDPNKHPCRYCKRRSPTCHGECEDYKEWNENRPKNYKVFDSYVPMGKAKVAILNRRKHDTKD